MIVTAAVVLWVSSSAPETPGNAVLDLGSDVALGDHDGAWNRLCSDLRADALGGPGADFAEVQEFQGVGSISTNYQTEIDGNSAREPITVRPRGVPNDDSNEQWVALLVREEGDWRVCGFERA